ncbi:hypothetical protein, partial [Kineococcus indalonis]|uniref:hypothetical protein n=1 Tax=Kineococcus indalonis TaxID=2696566 RepID=UPI00196B44C8
MSAPAAAGTAAAAVAGATVPRPPDVRAGPARFALELRPEQDEVDTAGRVRTALAPAGAVVRPLSELEPRVLLVVLPGRLFGAQQAAAFGAAEALRAEFDVLSAEPDLPTAFFPEAPPAQDAPGPGGRPLRRESGLGGFPPGCWVPPDPALDADP